MKSLKLSPSFFAATVLAIVSTLFIFACQKEEGAVLNNPLEAQIEGKFKKQVTLKDASGENWMILEVSANSADELAGCPVEHFTLTPVLNASETDVKPESASTPAETASTPDQSSPRYFLNIIDQHMAPGVMALSIGINSSDNAQDRAWLNGGWYTTGASNCGFGWKFKRNAGPTFSIYHYYSNNCQNPNIFEGFYPTRVYFSSGYFWGMKHSLTIYIPSGGDYTWTHGQFPAGNW